MHVVLEYPEYSVAYALSPNSVHSINYVTLHQFVLSSVLHVSEVLPDERLVRRLLKSRPISTDLELFL